MEARPNKCWSVALKICADGCHRSNPQLTISGELLGWMVVTFAILAAQPMCMALNFEAVLRLKPLCAHGWIAWITSASPPLPSYGFTNT